MRGVVLALHRIIDISGPELEPPGDGSRCHGYLSPAAGDAPHGCGDACGVAGDVSVPIGAVSGTLGDGNRTGGDLCPGIGYAPP